MTGLALEVQEVRSLESLQRGQKQEGTTARVKSGWCSRDSVGRWRWFSPGDIGKPLHGRADARLWLDWEPCANWATNQERDSETLSAGDCHTGEMFGMLGRRLGVWGTGGARVC